MKGFKENNMTEKTPSVSEKKQTDFNDQQVQKNNQNRLTEAQKAKQKKNNIVIACALVLWLVLIFLITLLKVKSGVFMRDL